jgi:hypothetical protein
LITSGKLWENVDKCSGILDKIQGKINEQEFANQEQDSVATVSETVETV